MQNSYAVQQRNFSSRPISHQHLVRPVAVTIRRYATISIPRTAICERAPYPGMDVKEVLK